MNIDLIRQDTEGCADKIFLNSAGSSLMPWPVIEKITGYLLHEEKLGGYEVAHLREAEINEFYTEIAKLINCNADNIAFAYNATDAYAKALSSISFKKDDYILTTNDDYSSNLIAFSSLKKRFDLNVIRAKNLSNGDLDLYDFERTIQKYNPVLVALTHIPTNSGLIQQAEEIGKICKKYDTWYLLDACQSIGQLVVDVKEIGCDFLSATGRKFLRGPRGTGFLYVSDKVLNKGLEPLFIDMRGADLQNFDEYKVQKNAKRFELWELAYSSLCGLTEAVRYANNIGMKNICEYNQRLLKRLRENLSRVPDLELSDKGSQLGNIVTFKIKSRELNEIESALKKASVYFSVSTKHYSTADFSNDNTERVIRLSPHYFNTLGEMDAVRDIIASI